MKTHGKGKGLEISNLGKREGLVRRGWGCQRKTRTAGV